MPTVTERCNYRKRIIKHQRSLRDYPFKKRKFYDFNLASNSGEGISCDRMCAVPKNGTNDSALGSRPNLQIGKYLLVGYIWM